MSEDPRVTYGREHPDMTLQEIADHFGLTSRERVRQVFRDGGYRHPSHIRTAVTETRVCYWPGCRKTFVSPVNKIRKSCDTHIGSQRPATAERITVSCEVCGKTQTRTASNAKTRALFFCGNACQGRWLGQQNQGRRRVPSGGPNETDQQSQPPGGDHPGSGE